MAFESFYLYGRYDAPVCFNPLFGGVWLLNEKELKEYERDNLVSILYLVEYGF